MAEPQMVFHINTHSFSSLTCPKCRKEYHVEGEGFGQVYACSRCRKIKEKK